MLLSLVLTVNSTQFQIYALTQVARSYALLTVIISNTEISCVDLIIKPVLTVSGLSSYWSAQTGRDRDSYFGYNISSDCLRE